MAYRFVTERDDYTDLAAGAVFHGLPGYPAFPVRLTSEIFQRCLALRENADPCTIYDPCCGGGYLLATLAYAHWDHVAALYASDADDRALEVAARNLGLLTLDGIQQRLDHIDSMIRQFGKASHQDAYQSAQRIQAHIAQCSAKHSFPTRVFPANVLTANLADDIATPVDIVITDIPYGNQSDWLGLPEPVLNPPSWYLLESLLSILSPQSLVAISSNKQQKVSHPHYRRADHFQIGKRRIEILRPVFPH